MSTSTRDGFSLYHRIKKVSRFADRENQYGDEKVWCNVTWKLRITKLEGFLGVFLDLEKTSSIWGLGTVDLTDVEFKVISDEGQIYSETCQMDREISSNKGFSKFLEWDTMKNEYVVADSVKIEVCVKFFDGHDILPNRVGQFRITHIFKNLARFEEDEIQLSDIEECSEIPWRICVSKSLGYFGCYLQLENVIYASHYDHFEANCTLRLMSKGKEKCFQLNGLEFFKPAIEGDMKLIKWDDLMKNYSVNDTITVVADVSLKTNGRDSIPKNPVAKQFLISQQFSNLSKIQEGESLFGKPEKRFNISWTIELKQESGYLSIYLYCGEHTSQADYKTRVVDTDGWINIVSTNGKSLMKQLQATFRSYERNGVEKFIRWDEMLADYVINDSIHIEAHIEILKITEEDPLDDLFYFFRFCMKPIFHERKFFLSCTMKNISRFQDGEKQWSNTEVRYGFPWRIQVKKTSDYLDIYLFCDEEFCEDFEKRIETKCMFNLVSTNGNNMRRTSRLLFNKPGGQGIKQFVEWNDMLEICLNPLEDSVILQAHVNILMIEEYSREIPPNEKSFLMSHTVANVSNVEEGNVVVSVSEEWYDVLWSMSMKRNSGFVELLLSCDKELNGYETWCIEARFQFMLVGADGKRLTDYFEHNFEKPDSMGSSKVIRWEDMLSQCTVNDSLRIEARVVFILVTDFLPMHSFIMSHTLKNLSRVQDGNFQYSETEYHCDIPWRISLKKEQMCVLIYLHCDKLLSNDEHWSIQVEVQLVLVSETGRTSTDNVTHVFERPEGISWTKRLTWENLERDFMVNDGVNLEARVKIIEPIEDEDERVEQIMHNFEE